MKWESPEHVRTYVTDFGSVEKEEASSSPQKQKEKEESNENFEPNYKRVKLENDSWSLYATSYSSNYGIDTICDGDECSSAMELDAMELDDKDKEAMSKDFHYQLQLAERFFKTPLIQIQPEIYAQPETYTVEYLRSYVPTIFEKIPELKENAPDDASIVLMEHILSEMDLFIEHEIFEAVKRLYEIIPYVTCLDSEKQIREKIDLKVKPFSYFRHFYNVVELYKRLLRRREKLFHPLIRKSYKDEFFELVDEERKLAKRDFLKSCRQSKFRYYPQHERYYQEISRAKGLRDEYYQSCCKQIELQEEFDTHLLYYQNTKLLQSGGCIEELINDVDVVPEKFKQLNTELLQLSLKASIEAHQWYKKHTQWYTNLELLKEKHRKKETGDINDKLILFCKSHPRIFDFSLNEAFESATEERFKDIIVEMKKEWFVGIADHYVIEATLLYMKSIYYEGESDEPSWPIAYPCDIDPFPWVLGTGFAHEHPIYEHVFNVDYKLA